MRKLMQNLPLVLAYIACFVILGWCAFHYDASSVEAKASVGPSFAFSPLGKEAKTFWGEAQMGYTEVPGFINVGGQWYKVHWSFHEKRVQMHRIYSPPDGERTCMVWDFVISGAYDD